jgi:glucan biosynthesis protein C
MNRTIVSTTNRLLFFDMVRNLAMLSVILFHAVAAYSTVTPHWGLHDGSFVAADIIRHLFDVFMMPVFFFVAGYFALPSLTKQGWWGFLKGKLRRIGIPWLLAILLVLPMLRHMKPNVGPHPAFWTDWLVHLKSFGTFQIGLWTPERTGQLHFWFLSLLLSFFIILTLSCAISNKRSILVDSSSTKFPASNKSILSALFVTAVLASLGYFLVNLMTPEKSWITIDLLLQFQPTSLISYIACFTLGAYAYWRQWFAGDAFPNRLMIWILLSILLTAGFFIAGRDVFSHFSDSHKLPPLLLLGFSFTRTFLCLTFLVLFIAYARKYWNRPSKFSQNLSANSYNIYLVHFFFVIFFQGGLTAWHGSQAMAKAGIVFLFTLPFSYGFSRLIDRFPRGFVIFLVALFLFFCVARYIGI